MAHILENFGDTGLPFGRMIPDDVSLFDFLKSDDAEEIVLVLASKLNRTFTANAVMERYGIEGEPYSNARLAELAEAGGRDLLRVAEYLRAEVSHGR